MLSVTFPYFQGNCIADTASRPLKYAQIVRSKRTPPITRRAIRFHFGIDCSRLSLFSSCVADADGTTVA